MNKTVSINLGGQVFQIDEHAYERLWRYLESIKLRYANTKGGDDIVWDIENRLAEMFYEYLGTSRQVVSMADVEQTITVMGRPEDFEIPLEDEEDIAGASKKTTTNAEKSQRRLFRNPDDQVISGVASGLSAYLGINDPVWMRIAFVIALFASFGSSLVVYIILVIIIPEAKTASEKLQMRGEPINIDNIEKTIREELNDFESRINSASNSDKARGFLARMVDFMVAVLKVFFSVLGKLIGFALASLGVLLLISVILGISIPSVVQGGISFSMLPHLFNSTEVIVAAVVGFSLLALIPILLLIYSGLAMLINKRRNYRGIGVSAIGLFVASIILVAYSVTAVKSEFDVERSQVQTITLAQPIDGIMRLHLANDPRNQDDFKAFVGFGSMREEHDTIFLRNNSIDTRDKPIVLDIVRSPSADYVLEITLSASGKNSDEAFQRTQNLRYKVQQDSAHVYFPAYIPYPTSDKIRGQSVKLILKVPEGKAIYLSHETRELIYDIKNVTNTYDGKMVGHTWKMMPEGLTCLDCGTDNGAPALAPPAAPSATGAPQAPSSGVSINLSSFNTLKVDGAITFYVVPANESRLVFGEAGMQKNTTVNTNGQTLTVSNNKMFGVLGDDIVVWIYTPSIKKAIILGASEGVISGFTDEDFHIELAGASQCDLNVNVSKLTLRLSGASEMHVQGVATKLDAEAAGASDLKGFGLTTETALVHASGASNIEVNASKELNAEANGASSIDYKGSPKLSSSGNGFSSINAKP